MPALGRRHAPQDLRLPVGHPLRDQLVHGPGLDLAAPRLDQTLADLWRGVGHVCEEATRTMI